MRFAVIPTRNRPEAYAECVAALRGQVDELITVAHMGASYAMGHRVEYREDPPNISRMWLLGLRKASELAAGEKHFVAVLNDDCVVPPHWCDTLQRQIELNRTVIGSGPRKYRPRSLAGYAYMVQGDTLLPDERWAWFYSDDYLEEEAKLNWGGITIVHGLQVAHSHRGMPEDPALAEVAQRDLDRWETR